MVPSARQILILRTSPTSSRSRTWRSSRSMAAASQVDQSPREGGLRPSARAPRGRAGRGDGLALGRAVAQDRGPGRQRGEEQQRDGQVLHHRVPQEPHPGSLDVRPSARPHQSMTARHTSPVRCRTARNTNRSVPCRSTRLRRTSNDPLEPLVLALPDAEIQPLCLIFHLQTCPGRVFSTLPRNSIRRSSSAFARTSQSAVPEQEPLAPHLVVPRGVDAGWHGHEGEAPTAREPWQLAGCPGRRGHQETVPRQTSPDFGLTARKTKWSVPARLAGLRSTSKEPLGPVVVDDRSSPGRRCPSASSSRSGRPCCCRPPTRPRCDRRRTSPSSSSRWTRCTSRWCAPRSSSSSRRGSGEVTAGQGTGSGRRFARRVLLRCSCSGHQLRALPPGLGPTNIARGLEPPRDRVGGRRSDRMPRSLPGPARRPPAISAEEYVRPPRLRWSSRASRWASPCRDPVTRSAGSRHARPWPASAETRPPISEAGSSG